MDNNIERRFINFEIKAIPNDDGTESRTIEGHAAVTEKWSDSGGWYREKLAKGAFTDAIGPSDIKALLNHDSNHLLARKRADGAKGEKNNTLEVWEDKTGLGFRYNIPESRDDILEMIKRGDLSDNSFAFTIKSEIWEEDKDKDLTSRTIIKAERIYDVALVTYPFYQGTDVNLVSNNAVAEKRFCEWKQSQNIKEANKETTEGNLETLDRELALIEHDL